MRQMIFLGLLLLLLATAVGAQTPAGDLSWLDDPSCDQEKWSGEPITMSLRDADVVQVLESMGRLSGLDLTFAPGIEGPVTVELDRVAWDQALCQVLRINRLSLFANELGGYTVASSDHSLDDKAADTREPEPPNSRRLPQGRAVNTGMDVDLERASVLTIVDALARKAEAELVYEPTLESKLHDSLATLSLENASWQTVLDAATEPNALTWRLQDAGGVRQLVIEHGSEMASPLTLELENKTGSEALREISKRAGHNFVQELSIDGTVTLRVENVSVDTALDAACAQLGCRWHRASNPDRLVIDAAEKAPTAEPLAFLNTPLSIDLDAAPSETVLQSFAMLMGDIGLDVDGTLGAFTGTFDQIEVRHALDEVCAQLGCSWGLELSPKGIRLRVSEN